MIGKETGHLGVPAAFGAGPQVALQRGFFRFGAAGFVYQPEGSLMG
jgi:hypothetical protein